MINIEMARDYFYRSKRCLREASASLEDGDYAGAIRRIQEALEMAVKSLLRALAIEYPRTHDVSDVLIENVDKLLMT
jgi:HEPN domain-containing protein